MKHGQMGTDRSSGPGTPLLGRVHDNSFLWVASFLLLIETQPEKILYIYILNQLSANTRKCMVYS